MKVIYILKKGFQYFPPCLTQVLYLNDLGINVVVYHGEDTKQIYDLLESRKIEHYVFNSDKQSKNRFESAVNFIKYRWEVRKVLSQIPNDDVIWFGNCESAAAVSSNVLSKRRFVISVLELYSRASFLGKKLCKIIKFAEVVLCCEKHRAMIMRAEYRLGETPYVIPNKLYEMSNIWPMDVEPIDILNKYERKTKILYQGIISQDRPLDKIAKAINNLNDDNIVFVIMGKCNKEYEKKIKSLYKDTVFLGFIPAPQHLVVTEKCQIGIANYDLSSLNNVFCAPNKIYEYARFGLPMLTSENIGLTETVGAARAAECVNFENVESILVGLKKIIDNYDEYSKNAIVFYNSCENSSVIRAIVEKMGML